MAIIHFMQRRFYDTADCALRTYTCIVHHILILDCVQLIVFMLLFLYLTSLQYLTLKATSLLYDTKYTTQNEGPAAGYNIIGSLLRAGPVPAFQRIVNADTYEQAVLKYIAKEGCGRVVSIQ